MATTSSQSVGILDRIKGRLGLGDGGEPEEDTPVLAEPVASLGRIVRGELGAIRRLVGAAPVRVEGDRPRDPVAALSRHVTAAGGDEVWSGDAETFREAVRDAPRWNLRRFKLEHGEQQSALESLLDSGAAGDLPEAISAELLEELLETMRDVSWHVRGHWLTTEFEKKAGSDLKEEILTELAEDVGRLRERCEDLARRLVDALDQEGVG